MLKLLWLFELFTRASKCLPSHCSAMHTSVCSMSPVIAIYLLVLSSFTAARSSQMRHLQQVSSSTASSASTVVEVLPSSVDSQLGVGALLCYVDTSEYFAQAISVPQVDGSGEAISCYSFDCTNDGSNGCYSSASHGWERTKDCEARMGNPAFKNVVCCDSNACNMPDNSSRNWTYVGPATNEGGNLSCYFNGLSGELLISESYCTTIMRVLRVTWLYTTVDFA